MFRPKKTHRGTKKTCKTLKLPNNMMVKAQTRCKVDTSTIMGKICTAPN